MPEAGARAHSGDRLIRSSLVVGGMTLVSRVAGMARDVVMAALFGANANADAFFVAFRIPQFLRRLFAEGAFAQAFVPVLTEYRATRTVAEVKALVDAVSGVLGAALILTEERVVQVVAEKEGVAPGDLAGPSRLRSLSRVRSLCALLGRDAGRISLARTARLLRRDPSTLSRDVARYERRIAEDPEEAWQNAIQSVMITGSPFVAFVTEPQSVIVDMPSAVITLRSLSPAGQPYPVPANLMSL